MLENILRLSNDQDQFDMLNEVNHKPTQDSYNPFESIFSDHSESDGTDVEQHFVHPHFVESYSREDGTLVEGYWRDGDGDTQADLQVHEGGGYMQTNPDQDLMNNLTPLSVFEL